MRRFALLFLLAALLMPLASPFAPAAKGAPLAQPTGNWPIPGGRFYTQTAPAGYGFSVTDGGHGRFWTEFNRLGGLQNVGYPISQPFVYEGFMTQAFQKLVLQWRPEVNQAWPVNVFDELSELGFDHTLFVHRQTPFPLQNFDPPGATWAQIIRNRQALLNTHPSIRTRYFSLPDPLTVFGLPVSRVEDMGNHYAIRTQRAVFQQWKEDVPWAAPGQVTIANGGDIAKELGWLPASAAAPLPINPQDPEGWVTLRLLVAGNEAQTITAVQAGSMGAMRLLVSGNGGQSWVPGISLPACTTMVSLDYATVNRYYAVTCEGIKRWNGGAWELVRSGAFSEVAVRFGNANEIWATDPGLPAISTERTLDGGATWQRVGTIGTYWLTLDPTSAWTYGIWGRHTVNLYRSTGGEWEMMARPSAQTVGISSPTLDGRTGDLYVLTVENAGAGQPDRRVLWQSSNPDAPTPAEVSWTPRHTFAEWERAQAVASGHNANDLVLYAAIAPASNTIIPASLYRSTDGGATWARISTIQP